MNSNNKQKVSDFFASYSYELQSKMKRLDFLIGKDHWLSVGNYKESLLRNLLSNVLPKKFEVSTGFIIACDEKGKEIKSKQQDIIIWDSSEYAAIFRDGEFVILPPEACKAVIEIKSTLSNTTLKKALHSSDDLFKFVRTPYIQNTSISKYIFAFSSDLHFPSSFFDGLSQFYSSKELPSLSLEDRINLTKDYWPGDDSWSLFSIDGIFVLGAGAILRDVRGFNKDSIRFLFNAYRSESDIVDHIYTFFEHVINRSINTLHGRAGFYYSKQPGLLSLMQHLKIIPDKEKPVMIFPPIDEEELYSDVEYQNVYKPKQ